MNKGKLFSTLLSLFAALTVNAQEFHFTGHAEGVSNAHMLTTIEGFYNDTIMIDSNGNFEFNAKVAKPQFAYFSIMEKQASLVLFVENGVNCHADITFEPVDMDGIKYNKAILNLKGNNENEYALQRDFSAWEESGWPEEIVNRTSFADYRKQVEETLLRFRNRLADCKSEAFKETMGKNLNSPDRILMRYSWKHKAYDEDFAAWINSFNHNNPKNLDFAMMYFRWYQMHHPMKKGQKHFEWYFGLAKEMFTNQEIINSITADFTSNAMKNGSQELSETWEAFCNICTDKNTIERMKTAYEQAQKTMPGKLCEDFAMLDINDKVCHLSDFRGHAVFIDVWATWCGPCCMEIPFVEKLVEHYKDDSRIEFVSISFDSNRNAWVKKLDEDKPAWKQFICNREQQKALKDMFGIIGIPRFIFIDKDGKIISGNAPRPSSEGFIEYIDSSLTQEEGTVFVEKTFPEVLAQAKQEDKMVMIDCYATYCPQCVRMVREVFPKKEVGEYLNSRFVCAKYNLDKEAKEYSKDWDIHSFPTFLFMNADGEVQFRINGYRPSERFLQMVDSAYSDRKALMVEKQYQNGDRSRETVLEYLKMMKEQRRGSAYTSAAKEYLNANADNLLRYDDDYSLFEEVIVSPYDAAFLHVQDNKALFAEKYGDKVDRKLWQVWKEYPARTFVTDYNTYTLDEQKYRNFLKEVKQKGLPAETIDAETRMTKILIAQPLDKKALLKEVKKYAKMPRANKQIVDYYTKITEM